MSQRDAHAQLIDEGLRFHAAGNLARAQQAYQRVLAEDPAQPDALHLLGVIALQSGDPGTAVTRIQAALAVRPGDAEALANLANALQALGRHSEAIDHYTAALEQRPQQPQVRANLGNARLQNGQLLAAVKDYELALALEPRLPETLRNLASALVALERPAEAWPHIERARAMEPRSPEVVLTMGNVLLAMGRKEDAVACFRPLVQARPDWTLAQSSLGNALRACGQHVAAAAHYDRVLDLTPDDARAHFNRALLAQDMGELDRARELLERAIALDPGYAQAHRILAGLVRYTDDDAHVTAMRKRFESEAVADTHKMHLAFGLGKAYEDIGDYPQAFDYFRSANQLRRRGVDYALARDAKLFANLKQRFDPAFLKAHAGSGVSADGPIVVVGMPRSGTSLVEQILATHPLVYGGGELSTLMVCVGARLALTDEVDYTRAVGDAGGDVLRAIGADYCARLQALDPAARHVTDKLPMNFLHLGLLHLVAPNVRIVHCRRDPVATCLSIYKNYLSDRGHHYANDLTELGQYYGLYANLMDHWQRVLPGKIHEISYEALVADQEGQSRALLAALDLPWDENCLNFYANRRAVGTISAAQVRKPIYRSSVHEWRHYAAHLTPLIDALEASGVTRTMGPDN